jgi:putative sterol carrier protein
VCGLSDKKSIIKIIITEKETERMSDMTVQQLIDRMPRALIPEKVVGVNAVIQYNLSGEEGGEWIISIKDGLCTVQQGTAPSANMTLTADAQDYKDVITGKLNPMTAFMTGKLRLAGDLNLAMKLTSFFKM